MMTRIKDFEITGTITLDGKCSLCTRTLVIRDTNYTFTKNRGLVEFDNGETCFKCSRCGEFVKRQSREKGHKYKLNLF